MKLSIVIVNWNSKDYVEKCLESLKRENVQTFSQVIVVDSGSFDGCGEMLAEKFPWVEFIQSDQNIGFGRANNLGFSKTKGDILLLLNPDTELCSGAITELLDSFQQLPDAGLLGARLLNTDGSLQYSSIHLLPTPLNVALDSNFLRHLWWKQQGPKEGSEASEVEAVSGACMMLRSDIFRKLGGFDPRYFMYAEDMDLCFKIRALDLSIYHVPKAQVIHHGGASSGKNVSEFSTIMIREALWIYMKSNHGNAKAFIYQILMGISSLMRLTFLTIAWLFAAKRSSSIRKWWTVFRWSLGLENRTIRQMS